MSPPKRPSSAQKRKKGWKPLNYDNPYCTPHGQDLDGFRENMKNIVDLYLYMSLPDRLPDSPRPPYQPFLHKNLTYMRPHAEFMSSNGEVSPCLRCLPAFRSVLLAGATVGPAPHEDGRPVPPAAALRRPAHRALQAGQERPAGGLQERLRALLPRAAGGQPVLRDGACAWAADVALAVHQLGRLQGQRRP